MNTNTATNRKPASERAAEIQSLADKGHRAYACAVENDLCAPDDTTAVQGLLKCSIQWARVLTREARAQSKAERDEKITELADQGHTQREIAEEIGVGRMTVNRVVPKRKSFETGQTPKPTAQAKPMNTNTATNRKPASERAAEIQSLADKGHRASQIATELGVGVERVRELAK